MKLWARWFETIQETRIREIISFFIHNITFTNFITIYLEYCFKLIHALLSELHQMFPHYLYKDNFQLFSLKISLEDDMTPLVVSLLLNEEIIAISIEISTEFHKINNFTKFVFFQIFSSIPTLLNFNFSCKPIWDTAFLR